MKFFKTFFLFSIVSCNIGDRVKEDISNKIDNTKTELAITEDSIKTTFLNKYGEITKKKLNDSSEIKIKNTVIVLMETVGYIDSLKTVVGKLENNINYDNDGKFSSASNLHMHRAVSHIEMNELGLHNQGLYTIAASNAFNLLNNIATYEVANSIQIDHKDHMDVSSWKRAVNAEPVYHNLSCQQLVCVESI